MGLISRAWFYIAGSFLWIDFACMVLHSWQLSLDCFWMHDFAVSVTKEDYLCNLRPRAEPHKQSAPLASKCQSCNFILNWCWNVNLATSFWTGLEMSILQLHFELTSGPYEVLLIPSLRWLTWAESNKWYLWDSVTVPKWTQQSGTGAGSKVKAIVNSHPALKKDCNVTLPQSSDTIWMRIWNLPKKKASRCIDIGWGKKRKSFLRTPQLFPCLGQP